MKAAVLFLKKLRERPSDWSRIAKVQVSLYGSLALTGKGHGTDWALVAGLGGSEPDKVNPKDLTHLLEEIAKTEHLFLLGQKEIKFHPAHHLIWLRTQNLPRHPNGMKFQAFDFSGNLIEDRNFYSIGGGFIIDDETPSQGGLSEKSPLPFPFSSGEDLLRLGQESGLKIWQMILENEKTHRSELEIRSGIDHLWQVMKECMTRGFSTTGTLPGGMKVRRRAPDLMRLLTHNADDPLSVLDWVNAAAIAVNEENASFGRIVTAPTNGAAGVIPAVMAYIEKFLSKEMHDDALMRFFLTATAMGSLYKINASISGAEVGCQGEVGVASSMAAGALTEVLGGSNEQIENAAEIAMEHHLGMTCDPVGGLVQIPCIERNAMGAVKALNAARMSMQGDGQHSISLDRVIKTMWETGQDMSTKYKETSRGGLAMNVPEC